MTANSKTYPMLHFSLPSSAGLRNVVLRIPLMKRVSALFPANTVWGEHELAQVLPLIVLNFVERLDDESLTLSRADKVAEDVGFMRGLLVRIRTLLDSLREQGAVFALCPHCGLWEAEVSMNAYALTIAAPLPSTFHGPFLAYPSLATNLVSHTQPSLPQAARIRFELPSSQLGLIGPMRGGVLGEIRCRDEELTPQFSDEDSSALDPDDEDETPPRYGTGWRALSRLAQAMTPPLNDDYIGRLPAVDFFFLDLVHYLVALAPVHSDTPGRIRCARCKKVFLPIRRDFRS